jgi:hypothetical protein
MRTTFVWIGSGTAYVTKRTTGVASASPTVTTTRTLHVHALECSLELPRRRRVSRAVPVSGVRVPPTMTATVPLALLRHHRRGLSVATVATAMARISTPCVPRSRPALLRHAQLVLAVDGLVTSVAPRCALSPSACALPPRLPLLLRHSARTASEGSLHLQVLVVPPRDCHRHRASFVLPLLTSTVTARPSHARHLATQLVPVAVVVGVASTVFVVSGLRTLQHPVTGSSPSTLCQFRTASTLVLLRPSWGARRPFSLLVASLRP